MPKVYYVIRISEFIDAATGAEFARKTKEVLEDDRGWKKYGYIFVNADTGGAPLTSKILTINLVTLPEVQSACNTVNLSCYVTTNHSVFINIDNWNGGSKISKENALTLDEYRTYVICHEVGHSLGLDHPSHLSPEGTRSQCDPTLAGQKGSVMMQMSKGLDHISPCKPNCWPLDPSVYNERSKTSTIPRLDIVFVLALILIITFIFLAAYAYNLRPKVQNAKWHVI